MKFLNSPTGSLTASFLALFLITSCNPDDYFEINELVGGPDAYCSKAPNLATCQALAECQPAFEDTEADLDAPIYLSCIANPPAPVPVDPTLPPDPTMPPDPVADDVPTIEDALDANCAGLAPEYLWVKNITEKKSSGGGSKKTSMKSVTKVKVCHQTGNMSAHTIIIACPALQPHIHHHDDYLGACKLVE